MSDYTIIYYTSNREDELFEAKIRDTINNNNIHKFDIVSVSQKPINFGKNICVGEVGASNFNLYRQVLIGCEEAKTDYVIMAEADCLYPPSYFEPAILGISPNTCFRNSNIYIIYLKGGFYKKRCSVFSQVVGRKYLINRLHSLFKDKPSWDSSLLNWPGEVFSYWELYNTLEPCISFKTGKGLRKITRTNSESLVSIPYWGTTESIRWNYLTDVR